ncbi:MAG: OmpA family protein [Sphingomicrobium sp.]
MIARLAIAAAVIAALATPGAAQVRRGSVAAAPQPPKLFGIDLLRQEFRIATGTDTVFFGGSSAGLGTPAKAALRAQAAWLRHHPEVVVSIEGHAEAGDTRDHALAVGARRAQEVRDYLILFGVPPAQLTATSWGKERVAVAGTSEAAFAANRRVQVILVRLAI